jgi:small-conductance mechanosensitive channel
MYGEAIIISVSESDAIWNNTSRHELAKSYKEIIGNEVTTYKKETSFSSLAKEIGWALVVLLVLGLLIYFSSKLFKWTASKIKEQEGKRIKGLKIKSYDLFDSGRQVKVFLLINGLLKWIFIILLIYISLPILFGIFPWTEDFAETLISYVLNPVKKIAFGIWKYMPNLITIIVIVIVFRYVLKAVRFFKNEIEEGKLVINGFYPDWANPTFQIVRVLIVSFMMIVIFPYLPGSESPIFKGVSVFLGFLFTFGSMGSLSNIIAGIVLTYMRLFKINDRVKIGDVTGDVIEKSLLVTRIRTVKNEIISIPNSTVMSSHTINYSSDTPDRGLILHTSVTIGYDAPWKDVHQALLTAADRTEMLLKEPKPYVLQTSLEDFYVAYQINAYTKDANKQASIYSELHKNIQDSFNEAGLEIMSPHYRAARDGNATTIPADYLDKDYKAPGFNVQMNNETNKE